GSFSPSEYGKRRLPPSNPVRISVIAAVTNPTSRIPDATEGAGTWIFNQYEVSAGTHGPALGENRHPSRPGMASSPGVTYRRRWRASGRLATSTSHAVAPTKHTASTNSYMLPHGTRCAARPRATIVAR